MIELLVVIGVIAILASLLLPVLSQGKARVKRADCINNLRQIGIGFQLFATDHQKFPMALSTNAGGSLEWREPDPELAEVSLEAFRHFRAIGHELVEPRLLICPADRRIPARDFQTVQSSNVSYFIHMAARMEHPLSIVSGDDNLTVRQTRASAGTPLPELAWDARRHGPRGNLLFADGSVQTIQSKRLTAVFQNDRTSPKPDSLPVGDLPEPASGPQPSGGNPAQLSRMEDYPPVAANEDSAPVYPPVAANEDSAPDDAAQPLQTFPRIEQYLRSLPGSRKGLGSEAAPSPAQGEGSIPAWTQPGPARRMPSGAATSAPPEDAMGNYAWVMYAGIAIYLISLWCAVIVLLLYWLAQRRLRAKGSAGS